MNLDNFDRTITDSDSSMSYVPPSSPLSSLSTPVGNNSIVLVKETPEKAGDGKFRKVLVSKTNLMAKLFKQIKTKESKKKFKHLAGNRIRFITKQKPQIVDLVKLDFSEDEGLPKLNAVSGVRSVANEDNRVIDLPKKLHDIVENRGFYENNNFINPLPKINISYVPSIENSNVISACAARVRDNRLAEPTREQLIDKKMTKLLFAILK